MKAAMRPGPGVPSCLRVQESLYFMKFKSREGVMAEIQWLDDMSVALARAKAERKPILLDFFNPG